MEENTEKNGITGADCSTSKMDLMIFRYVDFPFLCFLKSINIRYSQLIVVSQAINFNVRDTKLLSLA